MDFITVSRCIVPEGTELWIRITAATYEILLDAVQAQGSRLMLPVSQHLHQNMPPTHSCYLRAFYCLHGSHHFRPITQNHVTLICTHAPKNTTPGKKASVDDSAGAYSRVNQNIPSAEVRFVGVTLPILLDGQPTFDVARDPAMPFYKFLKDNPFAHA